MKIGVVIPVYNEVDNVDKLINGLFALNIKDFFVVIVEDNSTDGTRMRIKELSVKYPIHLIFRERKQGLGSAYRVGFKKALDLGADSVVEMDADLSHNPLDIPFFIKEIQKGNDVVIGSRRIKGGKVLGWGLWRKFCSFSAGYFSGIILGVKVKDITSGFRAFRKEVFNKIDLDKIISNGFSFQEEMAYLCNKNGFKIKEIPVVFKDRVRGTSKLSFLEIFNFVKTIIKIRFTNYDS